MHKAAADKGGENIPKPTFRLFLVKKVFLLSPASVCPVLFLQLHDTDTVFNDDIYAPGFAHLGKTLHDTALRILFWPAAA